LIGKEGGKSELPRNLFPHDIFCGAVVFDCVMYVEKKKYKYLIK